MLTNLLCLLSLTAAMVGTGLAHAEPLDDVRAIVLDRDGDAATVQMTWNSDPAVFQYEVGCVSCIPNTVQHVVADTATLSGITTLPNSSTAMLYIIAYDSEMEIVAARQAVVSIVQ